MADIRICDYGSCGNEATFEYTCHELVGVAKMADCRVRCHDHRPDIFYIPRCQAADNDYQCALRAAWSVVAGASEAVLYCNRHQIGLQDSVTLLGLRVSFAPLSLPKPGGPSPTGVR